MWIKHNESQNFCEMQLEADDNAIKEWEDKVANSGTKAAAYKPREMPVVTLGEPQLWPLLDVAEHHNISKDIIYLLEKNDFYIAQFTCSFRYRFEQVRIAHAKFLIKLFYNTPQKRSDPASAPIAYDLHPKNISHEIQTNKKFVLNPNLKFMDFGASIGEFILGWEYTDLVPLIEAMGVKESIPTWYYSARDDKSSVSGSKEMYVLLKSDKGIKPINAMIHVEAKCKAYGSILDTFIPLENKEKTMTNYVLVK